MRNSGDDGRRILHLSDDSGCGSSRTAAAGEGDGGRGGATKSLEVGSVAGEGNTQ